MSNENLSSVDTSLPDAEALDRTLAGNASPEEATQVSTWLASHVYAEALVRRFTTMVVGRRLNAHIDTEAALAALQRRGNMGTAMVQRHSHNGAKPLFTAIRTKGYRGLHLTFGRSVFYAVTGVALGILAIVVEQHATVSPFSEQRVLPVSTYVTGNGQRAAITLPDGSLVTLDVASRLEVPTDYMAGNHTLRLTGEAFFTVRHHDGAPFTIATGQTSTRVLGTSFVVRHYDADTVTTVAVRDGKVSVGDVVVTARQLAEVQRSGVTTMRVAPPSLFSFATGILTLDDMPLQQAILELDRWYNADIRLGDPTLASRGISGTCEMGSLADLAAILELTLDVRVVQNGRILTLYPRR
jgi:transmembrane sensor